jgi:hypothetical protein
MCFPDSLALADDAGNADCLFFVTLADVVDPNACTDDPSRYPSLSAPTSTILSEIEADEHAAYLRDGGVDLSMFTTCILRQVLPAQFAGGTCANNTGNAAGEQGWCDVATEQLGCRTSIQFSPMALPSGGILSSLQCIDPGSQFASDLDAGSE